MWIGSDHILDVSKHNTLNKLFSELLDLSTRAYTTENKNKMFITYREQHMWCTKCNAFDTTREAHKYGHISAWKCNVKSAKQRRYSFYLFVTHVRYLHLLLDSPYAPLLFHTGTQFTLRQMYRKQNIYYFLLEIHRDVHAVGSASHAATLSSQF